jgi:hypothetical protein
MQKGSSLAKDRACSFSKWVAVQERAVLGDKNDQKWIRNCKEVSDNFNLQVPQY